MWCASPCCLPRRQGLAYARGRARPRSGIASPTTRTGCRRWGGWRPDRARCPKCAPDRLRCPSVNRSGHRPLTVAFLYRPGRRNASTTSMGRGSRDWASRWVGCRRSGSCDGCSVARCLPGGEHDLLRGGTITLVYPEGCAADLRGEFGTNAAFLPASLDGDIGAGPGVTSLGANAPAGYALYTVQGECRYVQYLTGPTFAGEFRDPPGAARSWAPTRQASRTHHHPRLGAGLWPCRRRRRLPRRLEPVVAVVGRAGHGRLGLHTRHPQPRLVSRRDPRRFQGHHAPSGAQQMGHASPQVTMRGLRLRDRAVAEIAAASSSGALDVHGVSAAGE